MLSIFKYVYKFLQNYISKHFQMSELNKNIFNSLNVILNY